MHVIQNFSEINTYYPSYHRDNTYYPSYHRDNTYYPSYHRENYKFSKVLEWDFDRTALLIHEKVRLIF